MRAFCLFTTVLILLLTSGCSSREQESVPVVERSPVQPVQSFEGSDRLKLPDGFQIGLFASSLDGPRMMALSPDGRLFVTEMDGDRVTILPDANGDGRTDRHIIYASGLNRPHGIAFHAGYLYIAETNRVVRYPFRNGDNKATKPQVIVSGIPTGGHSTRTITVGPDGKLYLSIGSSCNVCVESNPLRAAIIRYNADGSGREIYATGLRNAVGMTLRPGTSELWATDNGRDYLGDDLPPEEVNVIREGSFYGWPYAYGDRTPDPDFGSRAPDKVRSTIPPKIKIQAHSAPLGLTFYTGDMFPEEYRDNLFVAYHGSWNRSIPTGYKIVRFVVRDGQVVGGQHDFVTGWLQGRSDWGRPVDVLVGRDGSLFITDDDGGKIYRVTYSR